MNRRGFSMVEIIIFILVLAVFAAAVFVAVNSGKRLGDTYNAVRKITVESIQKAIENYILDNVSLPPTLSSVPVGTPYMIVSRGASTAGTINCTSSIPIAKIDLLSDLGTYLPDNIQDPVMSNTTTATGYYVVKQGRSFVVNNCNTYTAPVAEVPAAPAGTVFSGHLYSDEGLTGINCSSSNKTVTLLVNGVSSSSGTCTASSGAWSVTSYATASSGDIVTVFIDDTTEKATTIFKSDGTAKTDVDLYQDRVIVRSDTGTLSNANLNTGDSGDSDILYNVASSNLTIDSGKELHVWASSTFAPGAGNVTAPALLYVNTSATVSISSGQTVTLSGTSGTTLTLTGTVSGAGTLVYYSTTAFPSTGTISSILRMDATNGNQTLGARTYGGAVELTNTGGTNRTIVGAAGTVVYSSTVTMSKTSTGTLTLDLNTNDPASTFSGALTIGSGTVFSANSANFLYINSNYTNNGTFTDNSGTVTVAGSAQQTFSGTMTGAGNDFKNLTISNASGSDPNSSPSVIFAAAATTANSFTAATANTKIRFAAGQTYTFKNIVFNGQASGTRVYLRSSSAGSPWYLNNSTLQTVSYTNVKDSDASGSAAAIDATDGTCVDATGNTAWLF